jgi:hypothetical protein
MPKEKSKSAKSRHNVYIRSKEKGRIMSVRCSRCVSKNLECRVLPDSDQCGECSRSIGRAACDVYGNSVSSWESVRREEARLEAEEEKAIALSQEVMVRLLRLRKQQKVLKEKAGKML